MREAHDLAVLRALERVVEPAAAVVDEHDLVSLTRLRLERFPQRADAYFLSSRLPGPGPAAIIKSIAPISPRFFRRWIICWVVSSGVAARHGA